MSLSDTTRRGGRRLRPPQVRAQKHESNRNETVAVRFVESGA